MSSIMLTWIPREMASTLHGKGSGLVCFSCSIFGFAKIHLALL